MDNEEIMQVDKWFDEHTENYGTHHYEDEYSVDEWDLKEFSDFLREYFPDLIYIRCHFGTSDSAIWFFRSDLEEAVFA